MQQTSAIASNSTAMDMTVDDTTSAAIDCAATMAAPTMAAMMAPTMAAIVTATIGTARTASINRIADVAPVAAPVDDVTLAAVVSMNAAAVA